ncbi:MAG: PQQ-dependent sugar dehydrogenase [Chloroflexi bacterium]|nr:PQQ-dependent sugar dehydrogenase [Chloroflexota bacterium]
MRRYLPRAFLTATILLLLPVLGDALPDSLAKSFTPASQAAATLQLQPVASGISEPVFVTHAPDGSGRLFVVERGGRIKIVQQGQVQGTFLDVSAAITTSNGEQGLLGLAFHPNYARAGQAGHGRFVIGYTSAGPLATSCTDTTVGRSANSVARYQVSATNPSQADPATARVLVSIPDPFGNHNGGMVGFGPDGHLYVSTGDGGSAGDPCNNAQNLESLLGKILRLNVDGNGGYTIPSDNPFVGKPGRDEIWAYGLRNPWRFSFDRETGDLFIGDVGQGSREEINHQPRGQGGANYGWKPVEGSICYVSGCNPALYSPPISDYDHSLGCSVTGGYLYRGSLAPSLRGQYVFGDYCSGRIWSLQKVGSIWSRTLLLDTAYGITSFGEDEAGELYMTASNGTVYRFAEPSTGTPTPTVGAATATPTATRTPTPSGATSTPTRTPTATSTPGTSARADLVVTSLTASNTVVGQPVPLVVTVQNRGSADTGPGDTFDIHVYADVASPPTPANNRFVGHIAVPKLGPGASTTVRGEVFAGALAEGRHALWALADGHDTVAESNESDNTRQTNARVRRR